MIILFFLYITQCTNGVYLNFVKKLYKWQYIKGDSKHTFPLWKKKDLWLYSILSQINSNYDHDAILIKLPKEKRHIYAKFAYYNQSW